MDAQTAIARLHEYAALYRRQWTVMRRDEWSPYWQNERDLAVAQRVAHDCDLRIAEIWDDLVVAARMGNISIHDLLADRPPNAVDVAVHYASTRLEASARAEREAAERRAQQDAERALERDQREAERRAKAERRDVDRQHWRVFLNPVRAALAFTSDAISVVAWVVRAIRALFPFF